MYINTKMAAILLTLSLAACGGSSSSGDSKPPVKNNPPATGNNSNTGGSNVNTGGNPSADYSAIAGLYDVSTDNNEQYYYIDQNGVFTAYNYLGDAADSGDNCYRESIAGEANADLSGQTLTALDNGNFTLRINTTVATFEMAGNSVNRVSTPMFSAGGTLGATLDGVLIRLTTKKATDVSIEDINSMMCE